VITGNIAIISSLQSSIASSEDYGNLESVLYGG
jgi:hypothetical protein